MDEVCPEHTPFYCVITKENDIENAIGTFKDKSLEVVVKPQGLNRRERC